MTKKTTLLSIALVFGGIFYASINNNAFTNPNGAPNGRTGSPGDGNNTCATSGCHTGSAVQTRAGIITSNIPVEGYTPGQRYTITATTQSTRNDFGFQISPQSLTGTRLGTMIITNASETKLTGAGKYITQTNTAIGVNGVKSWSFDWTAPAAGTGNVTFYGCFNYANGDGGTSGDSIVKSTLVVTEKLLSNVDLDIFTQLGFSIYPMPVNSELNLKNNHNIYVSSVQIFDINGRLMMTKEVKTDGSIKFNIENLAVGTYIINISDSNKSLATSKLIKN
ncbi:MAG: choice-of-anchor V domain-containing protein [bacterium]|jgi:hypothetical protein